MESIAFFQCLSHRLAEKFDHCDRRLVHHHSLIRTGQMTIIELLAVHTVQEEIRQIQHYSFAAFAFDDIDDIVIGIRMIFDQDLSYNAHARLLYIQQRQLDQKLLYVSPSSAACIPSISAGNDIISDHVAALLHKAHWQNQAPFHKAVSRTAHA